MACSEHTNATDSMGKADRHAVRRRGVVMCMAMRITKHPALYIILLIMTESLSLAGGSPPVLRRGTYSCTQISLFLLCLRPTPFPNLFSPRCVVECVCVVTYAHLLQ